MNRKLLVTTIASALALSCWAPLAVAQDPPASTTPPATEEDDDADELDRVIVTGSLIPQAQRETASPVTTITAEDIQTQGFKNVSEALRAQPLATGAVQDNQYSVGFTPGATTISLLGLQPGFTLILIDGRPLADYPLLYNGQSNFTDLSSIPTAMVERIDILPGNQSAIYGSAAIAGVVNIILKKDLVGTQLAIRLGGYDDGGGENLRFQASGGHTWDRFKLTYGFQYSKQDPIWAYQRPWTESTNKNPDPQSTFGSRTFLILDGFTGAYIDPGAETCAGLASNFGGTTIYDFRPDPNGTGLFGNYCGSRYEPGYTTILNEETGTSIYLNGSYTINDDHELYASLLYGNNKTETNSGSRFWNPDVNGPGGGGYIFDDRDGSLNLYQHIFSPEETGGVDNYETRSDSYHFAFGIRGTFGGTWDYDAYYTRSEFKVEESQVWPLTADIEAFFQEQFLGPQLGTYYGYAVYNPNQAGFYQSLTPEQYASFLGEIKTDSKTWTQNLTFLLTNTELFDLPAGSVGMAALVQVGDQSWDNPTDPGVIAGDFWGITGTQGNGERSSYAAAVEFRVPIIDSLTANISGRYDHYTNEDANSDSKATYKLGLEYRPMDTLLLRANYATAFRAPDMAFVFAGESGFFTTAIDYFRCEDEGQPLEDCQYNGQQIQGSRQGSPELESITANSYGFGFVWSPSPRFDLRADYYNVDIDNEVADININRLLFTENECRQGRQDITSPTCVDALERIDRAPPTALQPNALQLVSINPINIAQEKVSGIVSAASFRWGGGRNGNFEFSLSYNNTLEHEFVQFPGDEAIDYLTDATQSTEFKDVLSADFVWDIGRFTTTMHGTRYGSSPNYTAQLGVEENAGISAHDIAPYILLNLNVNYELTDNSDLTLTVNNLGDRRPPRDPSYNVFPYYNLFNYNGYGRSFWLQYSIDLGGGSGSGG